MYKETKCAVRSQRKHVVPPEKSLACVMGTSHAPQTNHKKKTVYFFNKLISQCVMWLLSSQSSRTDDILSCVGCVLSRLTKNLGIADQSARESLHVAFMAETE